MCSPTLTVSLATQVVEGMPGSDLHEVSFQCPSCGQDLKQTIGALKRGKHMICSGCGVGINIDSDRLAGASEEIQKALDKMPPEITIKFFHG